MSNDESSKEIVNESEEVVKKAEETVSETVEVVSDVAENMASKVTALKESNPKLFYGGIGAIAFIVIAIIMMSGGDDKQLPAAKVINLAIGQTYSLKGVNTYDPDATVRLVAVPGSIAAYDDTEEADRVGDCKHMPQGTKVRLIQIQEAFGNAKFVEIEMLDGECEGKKGWAVSNNLD